MDRLIEFVGNHPVLWGVFLGLLATLGWTFVKGSRSAPRVTPVEATRLINHEQAVVLDVRGDAEFAAGHVVDAVHMPQDRLEQQLDKLKKYQSRPVIAVCASGQTSARAAEILRRGGFERVFQLGGGLAAWESANLPLIKK